PATVDAYARERPALVGSLSGLPAPGRAPSFAAPAAGSGDTPKPSHTPGTTWRAPVLSPAPLRLRCGREMKKSVLAPVHSSYTSLCRLRHQLKARSPAQTAS